MKNEQQIREEITQLERTFADVIKMTPNEIEAHPFSRYMRERRSNFIRGVKTLTWVLDEAVDNEKYPCMRGYRQVDADAGVYPPQVMDRLASEGKIGST